MLFSRLCRALLQVAVAFLTNAVAMGAHAAGSDTAFRLRSNVVAISRSDSPLAGKQAIGFGFIVGRNRGGDLYIVTANHNVRKRDANGKFTQKVSYVLVSFFNGKDLPGTVIDRYEDRPIDLAVIRVARAESVKWSVVADGTKDSETRGVAVYPIGRDGEWLVPTSGGPIADPCGQDCLILAEMPVKAGMSGAAAVSENGIVGMIVNSGGDASVARIVPIKKIKSHVSQWGVPWQLMSVAEYDAMATAFGGHAESGNLAAVKDALARGADPMAKDQQGRTALRRAAYNGHREVAAELIAAGARDDLALVAAVDRKDVSMVDLLLISQAARPDALALCTAVRSGHEALTRRMLETTDPNSTCWEESSPLKVAAVNGYVQVGLMLIERGARPRDDEPLRIASSRVGTESFREALMRITPANRSDRGSSALHGAAARGDLDTVRALVSRGWNIDAQSPEGTPLYLALASKRRDVVAWLVRQGADASKAPVGDRAPILRAMVDGDQELVALLATEGRQCVDSFQLQMALAQRAPIGEFAQRLVDSGRAKVCK